MYIFVEIKFHDVNTIHVCIPIIKTLGGGKNIDFVAGRFLHSVKITPFFRNDEIKNFWQYSKSESR